MGTEAKPETCTTGCLLRNVLSVHGRYQSLCFVVSRRKSLVPEQGSGLSLFALFLMVLMDAVSVCTSVPVRLLSSSAVRKSSLLLFSTPPSLV